MKFRLIGMTLVCLMYSLLVDANNVKVTDQVSIEKVENNIATISFSLSWDNSWRDDYNWDAVWLFVKFKKRGNTEPWCHAYLADAGHDAGADYTCVPSKTGANVPGIFVHRNSVGGGKAEMKVRLQWQINGNASKVITADDIAKENVFISVQGIEMVYVPHGAYALGDNHSANSFLPIERSLYGPIPEVADIVDNNSGYVISASHAYFPASYAADHVNNPLYSMLYTWYSNTNVETTWKIDFNVPKTIKFFGVSGSTSYPTYAPNGVWYLEGSNDDVKWQILTAADHRMWRAETISYPVQHSIRVSRPGAYRYYRLRFPANYYTMAQNIAMTEQELYVPYGNTGDLVDGEDKVYLTDGNAVSLPVTYPKGFNGFYCMKYEMSQEQYVAFLNKLTYVQQKARIVNNLDNLAIGGYVFGSPLRPNARNGIALYMRRNTGEPVMFANNLKQDDKYFGVDDGQTIACNYLSIADMLAYCDWSGLRPMSELEYEKACRALYPVQPVAGEYAWGDKTIISHATLAISAGTENELPDQGNVNAGNTFGPLRVGSFGTPTSSRQQAGATPWGVMEMSGNLWEMCYNSRTTGLGFVYNNVSYSHGDGTLNAGGATDIGANVWPQAPQAFCLRGGAFNSGDDLLQSSSRFYADNYFRDINTRDSAVGIRAVRSLPVTSVVQAGNIVCENGGTVDTVCNQTAFRVNGSAVVGDGEVNYVWYISLDNQVTWQVIEGCYGQDLTHPGLYNEKQVYQNFHIRRKAYSLTGESVPSNVVVVCVLCDPFREETQSIDRAVAGGVAPVVNDWITGTPQEWAVQGAPAGVSINSATGVLSGITPDMLCNFRVTLKSKKCGAKIYTQNIYITCDFKYSGQVDTIKLGPGLYTFECWGASGGGGNGGSNPAGLGGFCSGQIQLNQNTEIYACVGEWGRGQVVTQAFNGGGAAFSTVGHNGGRGGGATDIRLVSGKWNDAPGLISRIMVAGGGGGAMPDCGGSNTTPGHGGGLAGQTSINQAGGYIYNRSFGGSQTAGGGFLLGSSPYNNGGYGGRGYGCNAGSCCGGGGSGYYGGGALYTSGGGGGSSFISGHPGCNAVDASGNHTGQPDHYSGWRFINSQMKTGVKSGDGLVRIRKEN